MRNGDLRILLYSFCCCFGAALLGGLATRTSVGGWYAQLARPSIAPPNEVFGPVWTLLYLLMALSLFLVWRRQEAGVRVGAALALFGLQLALNVAWSVVFFGLQSIGGGLAVIVPLWLTIALTIGRFWPVSRPAALLLLPYWLWVTFAIALNFAFWRLNGA